MNKWWHWWIKWWVWSGLIILIILFFSEPPQLWFWLTAFIVVFLYGIERTLH